jgi:hypothetical protein
MAGAQLLRLVLSEHLAGDRPDAPFRAKREQAGSTAECLAVQTKSLSRLPALEAPMGYDVLSNVLLTPAPSIVAVQLARRSSVSADFEPASAV